VQSEAGLTPGEIKQKRHGFHGFHGFVKKFSIVYWGRRLDSTWAEMLYEELPGTIVRQAL